MNGLSHILAGNLVRYDEKRHRIQSFLGRYIWTVGWAFGYSELFRPGALIMVARRMLK